MQSEQIQNLLDNVSPFEIRCELWKKGDYRFIVEGIAKNSSEHWVIGDKAVHQKQKEAFELLTANKYKEILYGGAAGGAKTWTGCCWVLFQCAVYPGVRCYIARDELKDIVESVYVTWQKVCKFYGFTDWKYNAVKNFIKLGNGSEINFIELKYKPSDPMYEDIGSTEYTFGWIEEVGGVNETGATTIAGRCGRHMNAEYGLKGTVLYTGNPKKNWSKREFYDKAKKGKLEESKYFLSCLVVENPFIEEDYIDYLRSLAQRDKMLFERYFKGNWDYDDNENSLCNYEAIEGITENDHVPQGETYLICDVARYGSDKARIGVFRGWRLVYQLSFDISRTTEIENAIRNLRRKYVIPKWRCLADEDGVGGGVVDGTGILGFINNARPLKEKGVTKDKYDTPEYKNLQTQCLYHLADIINAGGLWVMPDVVSYEELEQIKEELDQIQSKPNNDRKLECKSKADIKVDIGRSPDWRDLFLMRVYFDLKPKRQKALSTRKRTTM